MSAEIANGLLTHGRANAHVPLNEPGSQARHQTGTTMAKPRRASDDKLERLQSLADILAAMQTDDELEGDMSGDDAVTSLSGFVLWARSLSDARPAQIAKLTVAKPEAPRTFHDVYMEIQARPASPIDQARDAMGLAQHTEVFGLTVVIDGRMIEGELDLVTETDRYRFAVAPVVAPCQPCAGTGEIIENPPDDDERLVACPACGGTGEAITL